MGRVRQTVIVVTLSALQIKMKWQYAILTFSVIVSAVCGESYEEEEEGDPRLGYITVGSDGATSITFNATSIQNAVILGLFVLVLGALILPLFGISLGSLFGSDSSDTGYGYGFDQATYDQGFESSANAYNSFSKRSAEMLGPVMEALRKGDEDFQ